MSRCLPLTIAFLLACAQAYEDPKDTPVRIAGDENAVITGELDKPLVIRCLAYGYPIPKVLWTRDNRMVPFNDAVYEIRGKSLLIRRLGINTLGQYTCDAYNEIGNAASWVVLVRAYTPEGLSIKHNYLVARNSITTTRRIPLPTTLKTTSTTTTTTTTKHAPYITDSKDTPVRIAGDENAVITGELDKPLVIHCLAYGYPIPKVLWTRDNRMVPFNDPVYEIRGKSLLIRSLGINTLGQYTCDAYNEIGNAATWVVLVRAYRPEGLSIEHDYLVARNSITTTRHIPLPTTLETTSTTTTTTKHAPYITDLKDTAVRIAGDENAMKTGELDKPLAISCLAYGYPTPKVFWTRDNRMVPFNDAVYEISGRWLLIRSLGIDTLGQYTCVAYNEIGSAASWVVLVRAYRPEGLSIKHDYLVARNSTTTARGIPLPTTLETTSTTTTKHVPDFAVPVSVHVAITFSTLNIGAELRLTCQVDGYPVPTVYWTKDGQRLVPDERTSIPGTDNALPRLVISRVTVSDSGLYGCNAYNEYSSHSDKAQINVKQLTVPANCINYPHFARCELVARGKLCYHKYYSKFCCKSCVEAGQLDPQVVEAEADQPYHKN